MKKLITILILVLACMPIAVFAQDYSWMENAPDKYLPSATQMVISATSPCNQGDEAFKNFIPKFRTNKQFRDSRIKFSDEMGATMFEMLADCNNGNGYALLKAVKKNTRCDKSYGTWYNISADEVCFVYNDVLPCDEYGGGSVMARFQRIDGKWYITDIRMAG